MAVASQSASQLLNLVDKIHFKCCKELRETFKKGQCFKAKITNSFKKARSKDYITNEPSEQQDTQHKNTSPNVFQGKRLWNVGTKVLYQANGTTKEVVIESIQRVSANHDHFDRDALITIQYNDGGRAIKVKVRRHKLSSCEHYTHNRRKITRYCMIDVYSASSRTWSPYYVHDYGFIKETGPKCTNGQWFSVNNRSMHRWSPNLQCCSQLSALTHGSMCLVFDGYSLQWCYGKIVNVTSQSLDGLPLQTQNNLRLDLDIYTIHYQKNGKIYSKYLHQFSASLAVINTKTLNDNDHAEYTAARHTLRDHGMHNSTCIDKTDLFYYRMLFQGLEQNHAIIIHDDLLNILIQYIGNAVYGLVMLIERETYMSGLRHRKKKRIHVHTPTPSATMYTTVPLSVSSDNSTYTTGCSTPLAGESMEETQDTFASYDGFCEAIHRSYSSSMVNDRTTSLLCQCTIPYVPHGKLQLNEFAKVSIANKTPIAQFIVDIYGECVLKYGFTINDFMARSKFLALLSNDTKCWNLIRRHLSDYCKYMYEPIRCDVFAKDAEHHNDGDDDDNDDDTYNAPKYDCVVPMTPHPMSQSRMLYYISVIHRNIALRLPRVRQIDVVFITKHSERFRVLNDAYFIDSNLTFERLYDNYPKMMDRFNRKMNDMKSTRCVIWIGANDDICEDAVYIFEPSHHNAVPLEICNYTELPWICNTKSDVLSDLCISFHRYFNDDSVETERVYLHYHSYCTRIFRRNLAEVLAMICADTSNDYKPTQQVMDHNFNDHRYDAFVWTYFADLELTEPKVDSYDYLTYLMRHRVNKSYENRWCQSWRKYFVCDRASNKMCEYMYHPSPIQYYQYINDHIAPHMNVNNAFMNYILDHELDRCPVDSCLALDIDVEDCVLLDFVAADNLSTERKRYILKFLQNLYFLS